MTDTLKTIGTSIGTIAVSVGLGYALMYLIKFLTKDIKADIKNLYDITVKLIDSNRHAKDETKRTMTAVNVIKDMFIKLFNGFKRGK